MNTLMQYRPSRLSDNTTLSVLSATHMLVDACCAALVFSLVHIYPLSAKTYLHLVIAYNVSAFALQPLCGIFTDRFHASKQGALAGILFTFAALISLMHHPWLTVAFAGLGNAFFHIGGGTASLTMIKDRAAPSGIFVAPGAVGLAFGAFLGGRGIPTLWPFALLLILAGGAIIISAFPNNIKVDTSHTVSSNKNRNVIIFLLLASVALRSFTGFAAGNMWQGNRIIIYAFIAAAASGKAFGGILADRFGWLTTGMAALLLSALFFIAGSRHVLLALGGTLLFQMTMPVTLAALYRVFPGNPGLTFGLCCLALIVGAVPVFTPYNSILRSSIVLLPGILISTATFFAGLRLLPSTENGRQFPENRMMPCKEVNVIAE